MRHIFSKVSESVWASVSACVRMCVPICETISLSWSTVSAALFFIFGRFCVIHVQIGLPKKKTCHNWYDVCIYTQNRFLLSLSFSPATIDVSVFFSSFVCLGSLCVTEYISINKTRRKITDKHTQNETKKKEKKNVRNTRMNR